MSTEPKPTINYSKNKIFPLVRERQDDSTSTNRSTNSTCCGVLSRLSHINNSDVANVFRKADYSKDGSIHTFQIPNCSKIQNNQDLKTSHSHNLCSHLSAENEAFHDSEELSQESSSNSKETEHWSPVPNLQFAQVTPLQQLYSWDCGLTCILMILPDDQRNYLANNLSQIAEEENFHKSTWTIDLAYLLHKFGIPFRYYTITLGVDPGLTKEKFYQTAIDKDEERVVKRFAESSDRGMIVEKRSVPLTGILHHLKRHLPVIVLTNARLLQCQTCAFSKTRARIRDCFAAACDITYQGHFVVLVGYDAATQLIYYANPSVGKTLCCSKYQHIDNARLCYGTDEDVIFIDEYR